MDVQQFERLLMRYERLAGLAPRLKWLEKEYDHLRQTLGTAQNGNRRRDRDFEAAEAKIKEWELHAELLAGLVSPRRRKEMPRTPKPLETEIPF